MRRFPLFGSFNILNFVGGIGLWLLRIGSLGKGQKAGLHSKDLIRVLRMPVLEPDARTCQKIRLKKITP